MRYRAARSHMPPRSLTMPVDVYPLFAVPMGDVRHPDAAALNPALVELILRLEGGGYRNPDPVVHQPEGLFESEFDFFSRPEACVQALRGWVWASLGEFMRNVNPGLAQAGPGLRIASQTWFHVTRSGGYFGYHNHPMASWSGVYCVADGNPDAGVGNNGCLVFPHPLTSANAFIDPANAVLRQPFAGGNFTMHLKPGQLVFFPSWLGHYVTPFQGSAERITVAFNAWFSREGV